MVGYGRAWGCLTYINEDIRSAIEGAERAASIIQLALHLSRRTDHHRNCSRCNTLTQDEQVHARSFNRGTPRLWRVVVILACRNLASSNW